MPAASYLYLSRLIAAVKGGAGDFERYRAVRVDPVPARGAIEAELREPLPQRRVHGGHEVDFARHVLPATPVRDGKTADDHCLNTNVLKSFLHNGGHFQEALRLVLRG